MDAAEATSDVEVPAAIVSNACEGVATRDASASFAPPNSFSRSTQQMT
jgi:hypothetical protein